MKKHVYRLLLFIGLVLIVTACSSANNDGATDEGNNANNESGVNQENNDAANNEQNDTTEDVTVTMMFSSGPPEWVEIVDEALPHITIDTIVDEITSETLQEYILAGNIPDIISYSGPENIHELREVELDFDIEPLFDEHDFDWSRINEGIVDEIRNQQGGLYSIPIQRRAYNLYYNKDIFDMFGTAYPEDNMTWDEAFNLASEVTGEQEGKSYYGFDIDMPSIMLDQRQVTHVDPETDEVLYESEPIYQEYLQKLERLWSIPGILPEEDPGSFLYSWGNNFHSEEQHVAMAVAWDALGWSAHLENEIGMNWDIVTLPVWEEEPNVGPPAASFILSMTSTAEHPDAVYEIMAYMLSDEYQELQSRTDARATVLNDPDIQASFAADMDDLAAKNLESVFHLDPNPGLPAEELSPYRQHDAMWDGITEFARLETDVNTFLRQMQEETEELIRQAKAQE